MNRLRVMPLALGGLLAIVSARAQDDGIPSIFSGAAPRTELSLRKLELPELVRPRLPLSNQLRLALSDRMVTDAATFAVPARPRQRTADDYGEVIQMKRLVVRERADKKVEVENVPSYLVNVFTTGEIHSTGKNGPSLNWGLSSAESSGYGARDNTPRVALFLRRAW
jgi:hypothetical protein